MTEKFSKSWRGWIRSTDGFAIRAGSRTGIDYRDDRGEIRIDAERMSEPWSDIVVYVKSIPDTPQRPRAEVLERLQRAFDFAGWQLRLEDAWFE